MPPKQSKPVQQGRYQVKADIRYMIGSDVRRILEFEKDGFTTGWSKDELIKLLRQQDCVGMAAVVNGRVVGYMLYSVTFSGFEIIDLGVHPMFRRCGIGSQFISKLADLSRVESYLIKINVREGSLGAQLFLKDRGFRVESIRKRYYKDTGEDAYGFAYWRNGHMRCADR